jgi:hypothetical protein
MRSNYVAGRTPKPRHLRFSSWEAGLADFWSCGGDIHDFPGLPKKLATLLKRPEWRGASIERIEGTGLTPWEPYGWIDHKGNLRGRPDRWEMISGPAHKRPRALIGPKPAETVIVLRKDSTELRINAAAFEDA